MEHMVVDYFNHLGASLDWWVALIAGLPFPIWIALVILGSLYVLERR